VNPLLTICDVKAMSLEQQRHLRVAGAMRVSAGSFVRNLSGSELFGERASSKWSFPFFAAGIGREYVDGGEEDGVDVAEAEAVGELLREGTDSAEEAEDCRRRKGKPKVGRR
jgi:hypothetical protein